jgi:ribosomal protein S18 acetylase RimI-like enzyme
MVMDEIRQVREEDAAALQATFFPTETLTEFHYLWANWLDKQARGRMVYLLLVRDGQLVGHGQLHFLPARRAEIAHVEVAAAYRNQGLGTTLLVHLIQRAKIQTCRQVEICVAENNPRAQALYQRLGFQIKQPLYSTHDEPGLVMRLAL